MKAKENKTISSLNQDKVSNDDVHDLDMYFSTSELSDCEKNAGIEEEENGLYRLCGDIYIDFDAYIRQ